MVIKIYVALGYSGKAIHNVSFHNSDPWSLRSFQSIWVYFCCSKTAFSRLAVCSRPFDDGWEFFVNTKGLA